MAVQARIQERWETSLCLLGCWWSRGNVGSDPSLATNASRAGCHWRSLLKVRQVEELETLPTMHCAVDEDYVVYSWYK